MEDAPLGPAPRWAIIASGILVLVGLGIASYMTYEHFTGSTTLACSTTGTFNCLRVTTSAQSYVLGIPVAVLGLGFFVTAAVFYNPLAWLSQRRWVHVVRLALAIVSMLFVLWLLYAELIIIGSICEYCTGVHLVTFALFVITLIAVPPMLSPDGDELDE
jgi:uncharacterized membrane protein